VARPEEDPEEDPVFPPAPEESVSVELVRRIQGGERAAWNELFARYHDQLLLAVRLRLGAGLRRHLESEDIFQSVALEALRDLERFEYRGQGSLERYLTTLVLNKLRDRADTFAAAKRAGTVPLDELTAASLAAREPAYHAPAFERLERALNSLPPAQRELIVLRKLEGLSGQELAVRLGTSEEAARKAYSRALAQLATRLQAAGER
jgi:RNA polymerase sigma-70 factor, ECF subfamily